MKNSKSNLFTTIYVAFTISYILICYVLLLMGGKGINVETIANFFIGNILVICFVGVALLIYLVIDWARKANELFPKKQLLYTLLCVLSPFILIFLIASSSH